MFKRLLSFMLSLVILLTMVSVVKADDGELEILNNPPKNHVYTEIAFKMGKTEMTIFGYVNEEGKPQFRIYGKVGKTKGFFPVTVTNEGELNVESSEPVKDNKNDFGQAKIAVEKADIPDGFVKTPKKNIFKIINVFGENEHVAYASYDGENYYYFPIAKNNLPIAGSFPMDIDDMAARSKRANNNKKVKKPADFKNGFSKGIVLLTSEGGELKAFTAGPIIDLDVLNAKRGGGFISGGGGHRGGSNSSSSNSTVKFAQTILSRLGFLNGAIDGKLGAQTKKAISAFQAKNGLVQTGSLDKGTLAKMRGESVINSLGKTVLLKELKEDKNAKAEVPGLKVNVTPKYSSLGTAETQVFTVIAKENPNNLNNFSLKLQVVGPEAFSQTFPATGGSASFSFKTAGNYTARLFIVTPSGKLAGGDVKNFTVYQGNAQLPSNGSISEADALVDRYLNMTLGGSHGKSVAKNDYAQIIVTLNNTVPGHTYTITVSGPNLNSTVNGKDFNQNVQMLDANEKIYNVTVQGYLNGNPTNKISRQIKILAANTGNGGTVNVDNPKFTEFTVKMVHQGDKPSIAQNSTVKIQSGGTWNAPTPEWVEEGGKRYHGLWNPNRTQVITGDTTIVCNWTSEPISTPSPTPNPTPNNNVPGDNSGGSGAVDPGNNGGGTPGGDNTGGSGAENPQTP